MTLPLLTHLVGNSQLPLSKLPPPTQKRTQNTTDVLGVGENISEAKTHMQQVPTSFLRRKKETSSKSSVSTITKKASMPTGVFKRGKSQKTTISFDNLHISDWD